MREHPSAKAHAKAIEWARSVASDPSTLFLDTETTGLGDDAEVCDLGVVRIEGTVVLDLLVKPSRPIPPGATQVHGITDAMVAGADPWEVVYHRLVEAAWDAKAVVVYNLSYDLGVMNRLNARYGLQPFDGTAWSCALKGFSDWEGAPGKYPGSFRWFKLDDAAAKFGIKPGGHRALADAETARKVVLAMAASGEPVEGVAWLSAVNQQIDRVVDLMTDEQVSEIFDKAARASPNDPTQPQRTLFDLPDPTRFTR